ncbi:MAG TPA: hypothetical protein EYP32_00135 [Aquificaceae bacterium]|nr:hypothetical protein [Aquificaceae bacterium]
MEKEIKKLLGIREAASIKAIKKNIKRRGNKEFLYLIVVTRDMEGREKQSSFQIRPPWALNHRRRVKSYAPASCN